MEEERGAFGEEGSGVTPSDQTAHQVKNMVYFSQEYAEGEN